MRKVLITGATSYVGTRLANWLGKNSCSYLVDSISLRNESWRRKDFSKYDVVVHVAGIAHKKETKENADLYFKVNRDLAYETAIKSKNDGIKQFIFLSSMSVYGIESGVIDKNSSLNPKSNYGKSKLQAEKLISNLDDHEFKVAILRPPMIYGKGCKGNYQRLSKLAVYTPIFPNIDNQRSMIYIDNLSEFVKLVIDNCSSGLFFPQNKEYVKTSKMVRLIAETHEKKIFLTKLFNPFLILLRTSTVNKIFGDLVYEESLSKYYNNQYNSFVDFEESIKITED